MSGDSDSWDDGTSWEDWLDAAGGLPALGASLLGEARAAGGSWNGTREQVQAAGALSTKPKAGTYRLISTGRCKGAMRRGVREGGTALWPAGRRCLGGSTASTAAAAGVLAQASGACTASPTHLPLCFLPLAVNLVTPGNCSQIGVTGSTQAAERGGLWEVRQATGKAKTKHLTATLKVLSSPSRAMLVCHLLLRQGLLLPVLLCCCRRRRLPAEQPRRPCFACRRPCGAASPSTWAPPRAAAAARRRPRRS